MNKRQGKIKARFICVFFISLACVFLSPATHARVVGVVFDDSGSMANRFYTPLYALQLLLASLDESDKAFVVRMSHPQTPEQVPAALKSREQYLRNIGKRWRVIDNTGTPVETIYTALDRARRLADDGEVIKLVVITDGEFSNAPDDPETTIARYVRRLQGRTVDVAFVAIAPGGSDVLDTIDQQGMRRELLRQFNGDEDRGRVDITSASGFMDKMTDLIAWVNDSDPGNVDAIHYQGRHIEVTPPFPVKQLLVLTQGKVRRGAPVLRSPTFGNRGPDILLRGGMRGRDSLSRTRLAGTVRHLQPWPQWEGGKTYALDFDRPVARENARLMFHASVFVDWRLYDEQGKELQADAKGIVRVLKGQKLEVRARLYEDNAGRHQEILLNGLPHAPSFTLQTSADRVGAARGSREMAINQQDNYANAEVTFRNQGKQILAVRVRYPGFLDLRPGNIEVLVEEDRAVGIDVHTEAGANCPDCRAEDIPVTYTAMPGARELLRIQARVSGAQTSKGRVKLTLDTALPDGVWLELPGGKRWTGSGLLGHEWLDMEIGKPVNLRLMYDEEFTASQALAPVLKISAAAPWRGQVSLPLKLRPKSAGSQILPRGHTLDPTGAQPFRLRVTDVYGDEGLYFSVEGLEGEFNPDYLQLEVDSARAPVRIEQEKGNLLRLVPQPWLYSDCLTAVGVHGFTLRYTDPHTRQTATYRGSFELTPAPFRERCWQELLIAVMALLVVLKMICLMRTHRFPWKARLVETKQTTGHTRRYRLAGNWLLRWLWPVCRSEEWKKWGMHVRAARYGVELMPSKGNAHLVFENTPLPEHFEDNGGRPLRLNWGSQLEDRDRGTSYKLEK